MRRYERAKPGEMIHIHMKKLGRFKRIGHRITGDRTGQSNSRGVGWEFVHVAIDDHSRIAFANVMPSEKRRSAVRFLKATIAYYESLGIKVERVMTDNGSCYRSFAFRNACKRLGLRHIRTRPYTPRTTDVMDKALLRGLGRFCPGVRVMSRRGAMSGRGPTLGERAPCASSIDVHRLRRPCAPLSGLADSSR